MQPHHPAAMRNRSVILASLLKLFPASSGAAAGVCDDLEGEALEIGSSTGAHIELFAPAFPRLRFHPSEWVDPASSHHHRTFEMSGKLSSIVDHGSNELAIIDAVGKRFPNVLPAVALNMLDPLDSWPALVTEHKGRFKLIYAVNVMHFTGLQGVQRLVNAADVLLSPINGICAVYGPFKVDGSYEVQSNEDFDTMLRGKNPNFGLVDVKDFVHYANLIGRLNVQVLEMPTNNKLVVLSKGPLAAF